MKSVSGFFRPRNVMGIGLALAAAIGIGIVALGLGRPSEPRAQLAPSRSPSPPARVLRVPLPTRGGIGIAVDGTGAAWVVEGGDKVARYRAGEPVTEIQLSSQGIVARSAPDGAVWVTEPFVQRVARIATDGTVTEKQLAPGGNVPGYGLALGPDGSVWYVISNDSGLGRLLPDGSTRTYPVGGAQTFVIDSRGNAWVQTSNAQLAEIRANGQITPYLASMNLAGIAEAVDGSIWYLNQSSDALYEPPFLGSVESSKVTTYTIENYSTAAYPYVMVRAPDGAVWFPTLDNQLVRLVSKTDLEVFQVPSSDIGLGPFAVLRGNRLLMRGDGELFDFTVGSGKRIASPLAIPPRPTYAWNNKNDPAEATALVLTQRAVGSNALVALCGVWESDSAAAFCYRVTNMRVGYTLFVYVRASGTTWSGYQLFEMTDAPAPHAGLQEVLTFRSGCMNVRGSPTITSPILACLPSGSSVEIDGVPMVGENVFWWHLVGRGWAEQRLLWCDQAFYEAYPQC